MPFEEKSKKDNKEDQRLRRQMDNEKETNPKKINIENRINLFSKILQNPNDDKMEYIYQL